MAKRVIDEQLLIDAAIEEFSRKSYEDASINTIIANAKVSKGSFYYRFENKYALYIYLLKEGVRRKWDYIKSEMKADIDSEGEKDLFDFFLVQAELGVRFAGEYPNFHRLSKMFSKEKGSILYKQVIHDLGEGDESGINQMIEDAYQNGSFRGRYSLDFLNKLIKSLFFYFDEFFFSDEDYDLEKSIEYLKDFVFFMKTGLKAE